MKRIILALLFLMPFFCFSQTSDDTWFVTSEITFSKKGGPWQKPKPCKLKINFSSYNDGYFIGSFLIYGRNLNKLSLIKNLDVSENKDGYSMTFTFIDNMQNKGICKLYLNHDGTAVLVIGFENGSRVSYNMRGVRQ